MSEVDDQIYCFADIEVDTQRGCLRRDGDEIHLRQKSFQVLVYLLRQRDRLVTKDELIEAVWRETSVTDGGLVQCIRDIRRAIGDDPQGPSFIKTVPKSGYRFIGEVRQAPHRSNGKSATLTRVETKEVTHIEVEYEENDGAPPEPSISPTQQLVSHRGRNRFVILSAFALTLVAATVAVLYFAGVLRAKPSAAEAVLPNTPGKRSLAVMYFDNRSRDVKLDWLREGLADMLINDLSRSPKLNLLSRQQLQSLLDRHGYTADDVISPDNALEIARKSNAGSFVVGSFAAAGEAMRLDVKLYDAQTGELRDVESSTAEKPDKIFAEVDALALRLANRLDAVPAGPESQADIRTAMTGSLEAYRYYSLAVNEAQALHNKEAIALLERAIALDPEFAMGHARIGYIYSVTWGYGDKAKPYLEKAFSLSERLTEKDRLSIAAWYSIANLDYANAIEFYRQLIAKYPTETEFYLRLGNLLNGEEAHEEAMTVLKQGLAIDPDAPLVYNALGSLYSIMGRHDEAISMHQRYVALAPTEANAHDSLGMSYQWAGNYPAAIDEYRRAVELRPSFDVAMVHMANAYGQGGQYAQALELYKKYITAAPSELERARGYSGMAAVYRRMHDLSSARAAAHQAMKEKSTYIGEMFMVAVESGDRGTYRELSDRLFVDATTINRGRRSPSRYVYVNRGLVALVEGRPDEAIQSFEEAVHHPPPTFELDPQEDCLANAYLKLGRYDDAIAEYNRILQLNPNYPLARYHLAEAFQAKGDSAEATENYRAFLEVWNTADPTVPEVIAAKRALHMRTA